MPEDEEQRDKREAEERGEGLAPDTTPEAILAGDVSSATDGEREKAPMPETRAVDEEID